MYDSTDPRSDRSLRAYLLAEGRDLVAGVGHAGLDLVTLDDGHAVVHVGTGPADSIAPVLARTDGDMIPASLPHGTGAPDLAVRLAIVAGLRFPVEAPCPTIGATCTVARTVAGDDHAVEVTALGEGGGVLAFGPWVEDREGIAVRWRVRLPHEGGVDVTGLLEVPVSGQLAPGTHRRLLGHAGLAAGAAACAALQHGCPNPAWRITALDHVPFQPVDPDRWLAALTGHITNQ